MCGTEFGGVVRAQSPIIAEGAQVEKVGTGYGFTEGCTADKDGNVFFTDQNHDPGGQILRWSAEDGKITVWMEPTGRANGQRFAPNGDLITCSDEQCQLWRITPDKKVTVLVKDYEGKLLDGPNDVVGHAQRRNLLHRSVLPSALVGPGTHRPSAGQARPYIISPPTAKP